MKPETYLYVWILLSCALGACSTPRREAPEPAAPSEPAADLHSAPVDPANDGRPVIVAFGDSLTAGLRVAEAETYPSKLQRKIDAAGYKYRVVNAGVSGETSAQGLSRVDSIIAMKPALVILELGANDGLRGVPVDSTRRNLDRIMTRLGEAGVTVVLAGMEVPPNYGPEYASAFRAMFSELAHKHSAPFIPFFLQGVGGVRSLNQEDGVHPTAEGYDIVADNVWSVLRPLLANRPRSS